MSCNSTWSEFTPSHTLHLSFLKFQNPPLTYVLPSSSLIRLPFQHFWLLRITFSDTTRATVLVDARCSFRIYM